MSLSHRQQHQLHRIETGLLRSDSQLTAMLSIFRRLSAGEIMPVREQMPSRQHSIRQAAALTVTATTAAAEATALLLRAVIALVIAAAGTRHGHRLPAPGPEHTRHGRGAPASAWPARRPVAWRRSRAPRSCSQAAPPRSSPPGPGVLPPVRWRGRLLADGGIAGNTPVSHAAAPARRSYALPTQNPGDRGLPDPPRGALAAAAHAITVLTNARLHGDLACRAPSAELTVLPAVNPGHIPPTNFCHVGQLITWAPTATRTTLAAGTPNPSAAGTVPAGS
jgi:hypothetical protein